MHRVADCLRRGLLNDEFQLDGRRVWRGKGSIAALHVTVQSIYQHKAAPVPVARDGDAACGGGSGDGVKDDEAHDSHHHSHSHEHAHSHSHESGSIHEESNNSSSTDKEGVDEHAHSHSHHSDGHLHSHHHHHDDDDDDHDDNTNQRKIRNLPQIRRMLQEAPEDCIPPWVRDHAISAFTALAQAEAAVHGASSIDAVHFHEVGAVDSIVDTVGTLLALFFLGVTTVSCSRLPLGEGAVRTDHGILPVPAPATLKLMTGMPTTPGPPGLTGELVTPTGAALLRTLTMKSNAAVRGGEKRNVPVGRPPRFTLRKIGVGAGTKDFEEHPNIIRLLLGDDVLL